MVYKKNKGGFGPVAIIIVLAVVAAIGGGIYVASKNKTVVNADAAGNAKMETGTLRSLMAIGKDVTCGFSNSNEQGSVGGAVYISGNMMRGDFTTKSNAGVATESHMIRNGDTAYVWSGAQGAKMPIANVTGASATAESNANLDQTVNYQCLPWTKDDSVFAVPTAINFVDIGAMMKVKPTGAVNTNVDVNAAMKAATDAQIKAGVNAGVNAY